MKRIECTSCGADDFVEKNGYRICQYCGSRFLIEHVSTISLDDDISRLLKKCKSEPRNARKYANLILELDPTNEEAWLYLK